MVVTIHDINWIINPRYNSHNPVFRWAGSIHYRNGLIWSMNRARRIIVISNATRKAILDRAATDKAKLVGYHWTYPGVGFAERSGTAYTFAPAS